MQIYFLIPIYLTYQQNNGNTKINLCLCIFSVKFNHTKQFAIDFLKYLMNYVYIKTQKGK